MKVELPEPTKIGIIIGTAINLAVLLCNINNPKIDITLNGIFILGAVWFYIYK